MHLYSLTLQRPTAIALCVYGNFSGPKAQEILISRGKYLELLRPDENGKVQSIVSVEVFGLIRSIHPFRLTGGTTDYIVVGSDSGRITVLEYNTQKNTFVQVHLETFGKSGCRRIVPGEFMALDPKGRAVMISAVEKQKLVYVLNRDTNAKLTMSSPLEANKSHTITFATTGVDVGFENPIFACLEYDYEEKDKPEMMLVYYELDLGLNNVVRRWSDPVDRTSNIIISVPGGGDGPGGVLVCSANFITYKNQGHVDRRIRVPKRKYGREKEEVFLVASATHRQKDLFFFLVQNEYGDLFKVTLDYQEDRVNSIRINYFDTVPVATGLVVLKTGFLFVAAEFGNHYLFQFQSLGEDGTGDAPVEFELRDLVNLAPVDELPSLSPITSFKVADLTGEGTPQIYALSGRGQGSCLKVLRHGLSVTEVAVSGLPGNPNAVWALKGSSNDEYHRYIVVSFINATLVLSVGETVEEVNDTGILDKTQTLLIDSIADDSFIQVHPNGIRHIKADKRVHEWKPPSGRLITQATSNERQVVVALSGGHVVYFELSPNGLLEETEKVDLGREVSCLAIPTLQKDRQRALFLAIGDYENSVRIYSLEPEQLFRQLSVQALSTAPSSLLLVEMMESTQSSLHGTLFLNVGLQNGVLMRTVVDQVTGELTHTRNRFLGSRPVKLACVKVRGQNAILALSSRSWLVYNFQARLLTAPLSYLPLDYAAAFLSEAIPEAFVSVAQNTLRIIQAEQLGEFFNQTEIPLGNTPRKLAIHPVWNNLVILETEHNAYTNSELAAIKDTVQGKEGQNQEYDPTADKMETDEGSSVPKPPYDPTTDPVFKYGFPKAGANRWRSSIRLLDPVNNQTLQLIDLDNGEAAISLTTCTFRDREEVFIVIGTAMHYQLNPRKSSGGYIHVFSLGEDGKRLRLVHKTPVEDIPLALCQYNGRLLVGVGQAVRLYDLGKKKLLRKCDLKTLPSLVKEISVQGERIVVGDIQEGWHYLHYDKMENTLYIFADEPRPRWLTTSVQLDYDTMAGADKFGNIFVTRLPENISLEVDGDPTSFRYMQPWCNGAPHKAESHCEFHVGEVVTCLEKSSLVPGGSECLIYSTIYGTIGVLVPFISREDVDFFTHLEMHMRNEVKPLLGRDHLSFRSYYHPQKACIDGDFCEVFNSLDPSKQQSIADEMDRNPAEMAKKLDDMRTQVI